MIEICPAILTDNLTEFKRELEQYSSFFDCIDIDINLPNDSFPGLNTVSIDDIKLKLAELSKVKFNIHLMVENPSRIIEQLSDLDNATFIIHQEANVNKLIGVDNISLAIQVRSKNKPIEFYKKFKEIQLMTVEIGFQSSQFVKDALDRVEWLRSNGYTGKISLDGGVNLETAAIIRNYDIQRVSVGSYFSKSTNLELDLQKLNLALNTGSMG